MVSQLWPLHYSLDGCTDDLGHGCSSQSGSISSWQGLRLSFSPTLRALAQGWRLPQKASSLRMAEMVSQLWPLRCSHATRRRRRVSRGEPRVRCTCRCAEYTSSCFSSAAAQGEIGCQPRTMDTAPFATTSPPALLLQCPCKASTDACIRTMLGVYFEAHKQNAGNPQSACSSALGSFDNGTTDGALDGLQRHTEGAQLAQEGRCVGKTVL